MHHEFLQDSARTGTAAVRNRAVVGLYSALLFSFVGGLCAAETSGETEAPWLLPYAGPTRSDIDVTTLDGKVLCGYQGWFNTPGDGSGFGFVHWGQGLERTNGGRFTVDMWPDVSEYAAEDLCDVPGLRMPDGSPARLYSAFRKGAVLRHFQWMRQYGIDGVFLSRFIGEAASPSRSRHVNQVLAHVREGCHREGRVWAMMLDLSTGRNATTAMVMNDWRFLCDKVKVRADSRYLHHQRKPVLLLWGLGFNDRPWSPEQGEELIQFFKRDPEYGGVYLIGGIDPHWRTLGGASRTNAAWAKVYRLFDAISPWNAGRYRDDASMDRLRKTVWEGDLAELKPRGVGYMPTAFPGFSWDNLRRTAPGSTLIPRRKGEFYWRQFAIFKELGIRTVFVGMFDEVDEGTAIYKVANVTPMGKYFVTYEGLPSDYYLKLTGEATRMIRGETPLSYKIPKQLVAEAATTAPSSSGPVQGADSARAEWALVDGTRLPVPPPEHPRLYLRSNHIAELPIRLKHPVLQPAVERLRAQARTSPQLRVEWDALQYLVTRDEKPGRAVIEACLPLLQKCELADRQDACRETGRMMVTGAIVYDWCHGLLTANEKQAFIKELVRLAKTQECGYPPAGQGSVTGHASEAMIMRDMVSAGIAIHDEFPEMYRLAAGRFFREHLPVRNWFYSGHAYHQGDSYGAHRFSWDTYPLWIFDRLGAGNVYNAEQRFVPYLWVYTTRPDGQRLRAGDTFAHSTPRGRPWSEYMGTLFTASYYGDGLMLGQFQRQGGASGNETLFEVLWRDVNLQPEPVSTLPRSRYFGSPFGWMVARTGWGQDAVVAEMKVNEYNFVNHQHLDAGAFQIYFRGTLASDSGLYSGSSGAYGSPHCQNYYWRTIAHNSLLVYDPDEDFGRRGYGNDGGQRLPNGRTEARNLEVLLAPRNGYQTGKVLAHGFGPDLHTPDYSLLQGDLTAAYSKKVRQLNRSFVFLNLHNSQVPAALVVFDRVVSAQPDFRKCWLLHTLEEPRVATTTAAVDCTRHGASGRLNLDVLLPPPQNAALTKVGGPGQEYWVFGTNYANDPQPERVASGSIETSSWRLELSPKTASAEDHFLTVMQVTDRAAPERWPVRRQDLGERTGCLIEGRGASWMILFRGDTERSEKPIEVSTPGHSLTRVLVTDLAPGRWQLEGPGGAGPRLLDVSEDSGAAWFEVSAGAWTLSRLTGAPRDKRGVFGIQDTHFTLNGEPRFLLGISYYGALGAPEEFIQRDLDDMQHHGFNWLRVWATWGAFDHDVSALDARGGPREPFLGKLRWLVAECDRRGLVVDVTLTRNESSSSRNSGAGLPDFTSHQRAVETLVNALKRYRNWYLDLANERDVRDARYVSPAELKALRDLARRLAPQLLVTASFGGHDLAEDDVQDSLVTAGHDFLSVHRPRNPDSPAQTAAQTRACRALAKQAGRVAPVHHQEPFRRGYARWEPTAEDFLGDLRGAVEGGAAGWCFHNGSERGSPDNQPRRSFDLRAKRLFDQLDPEEQKVVRGVKTALGSSP